MKISMSIYFLYVQLKGHILQAQLSLQTEHKRSNEISY